VVAKRGLKLRHKQTEAGRRKVRWTMQHHIEDGDNVGSQPGHVAPDSQSGSLCAGSGTSRFERVDSDKEGTSSDDVSDEACEQENSKFG